MLIIDKKNDFYMKETLRISIYKLKNKNFDENSNFFFIGFSQTLKLCLQVNFEKTNYFYQTLITIIYFIDCNSSFMKYQKNTLERNLIGRIHKFKSKNIFIF